VSTLFLVATPIGNVEDMTLRAVRVLREAPLIAAEDTRTARRLLDHFEISGKRLTSYTDHNKRTKTPAIIDALADADVALVSDAGMPGISDPGYDLVVAALAAGHDVVPVPGASAVLAAVAASGLASRRFHYLGFLPRASGQRRKALAAAAASGDTIVFFESPHRVRATLEDARAALGDRRIAVARELTKLHEEIWRGTIGDALAHFAAPRGEFTIVIEGIEPKRRSSTVGAQPVAPESPANDDAAIAKAIAAMRRKDTTAKDAVATLADRFNLPRREAYRRWHNR
jgi:16S rRNA (cytidine1402-2'-O)-methyltransferase